MVASSSTSTSTVITTLVTNIVLCGIFVTCFLLLRLKFKRIYSPKASFDLVPEEKKPEPLPKDPFRWVYILLTKPHSFILQQAGLDGYFFLRYILVMAMFFMFGLLTWIILLPVNATNGNNNPGLDQLSIANVKHEKRYYAHVLVGWVFYGSLIYVIYRELFFYNSLRSAALSSPKYARQLSSRTVLFKCVPDSLLDEKQFFKMFDGVTRVHIPRTCRTLEAKIKQREGLVTKLEVAENKLLKLAVKHKLKADKKGETIEPADEISAYVPEKKRPTFKPHGMFTLKVDTIRYCLEEIPKIDEEIKQMQKNFRSFKPKNSLIVEFEDQYKAQMAYQVTVHHNPLRMQPTITGVEPADINWSNLRMFWWEAMTRRTIAFVAICALIILWSIPVAFVGVISNITYLTNKLPWLRWILKMPHQLLGIITGLLPTIMLSILMALLPLFIRGMAKVSGVASAQEVENYTQRAYFGFQVINGFLVTTIASSAASTVTQIVESPERALSILAGGLPKSSNFYISFLILQGLSVAGGSLFQVVGLFLYYILGYLLDGTLRKKYARFSGLGSMGWGTTFPVFTNLAVITLAYSIISPMILLFATVAFFLVYITYCYNLTYVFIEAPDNRGRHYPTALYQTFTGIYLGQICLLGIFAVGKGWGPIVLQVIGLIFTIYCHLNIKSSFGILLDVVPVDCMRPLDGVSHTPSSTSETEYRKKILDRRNRKSKKLEKEIENEKEENERVKNNLANDTEFQEEGIVPLLADRDFKTLNTPNPFFRFFRPDVYLNYRHAKELLPATFNIEPEQTNSKHAYNLPAATAACPSVWIPRDPMGLSTIEISEISKVVEVSDENSGFDEKGKIRFLGAPPL
ncbi:DUF221-domain-containing protein [Suhomyces tanzawaensis NRRL Y-17324]|uniref:DUF221-domain-containing protein n=1 Tax=Suhomyces tanzawaensis NRRL Y-17324 TaxID=984487 RepID=A0A1E4SJ93_9ASCO|nr:DUF221-domain-containing protein [Suhomyces tanzawaensis NRRL Y-17324]ODV79507.1 DUF221-domain-containing protein [Suhomyces tanzawaensis NRRL Y-17324]